MAGVMMNFVLTINKVLRITFSVLKNVWISKTEREHSIEIKKIIMDRY